MTIPKYMKAHPHPLFPGVAGPRRRHNTASGPVQVSAINAHRDGIPAIARPEPAPSANTRGTPRTGPWPSQATRHKGQARKRFVTRAAEQRRYVRCPGGGRAFNWGGVMVSWCQRQVPPPAGGSCPRSRPGQSGTIPQQVQHPVRRSANPPPPLPALTLSTPHGLGSYRADHTAGPPCRSLCTQGPQCIQFNWGEGEGVDAGLWLEPPPKQKLN